MTYVRWDFVVPWLIGLALLGAAWLGTSETLVVAAEPMATATPVDLCPLWKTAGGVSIYRCEDDQTGSVIFVNAFGFMLNEPY